MRDVLTFSLVAFSAVFFVVDPIAVLPVFLAITASETPAQKRATALRAAITCGITLTVFAAAGSLIFRFFGITLGAFKVAGGILLFMVALDMMQARQSRTRSTPEEEKEGVQKADVAIIPLAIPLLSGPGSIATVMVLMTRHKQFIYTVPVFVSIMLTAIITWLMLRGAEWLERRLSKTFMNVVTRVMGLILAAVAVEFVISGVKDVLPTLR